MASSLVDSDRITTFCASSALTVTCTPLTSRSGDTLRKTTP